MSYLQVATAIDRNLTWGYTNQSELWKNLHLAYNYSSRSEYTDYLKKMTLPEVGPLIEAGKPARSDAGIQSLMELLVKFPNPIRPEASRRAVEILAKYLGKSIPMLGDKKLLLTEAPMRKGS